MIISPKLDNGKTFITLKQKGDVVLNNTCNFLIQFPTGSKTGDIMNFKVNLNTRAKVFYTIAQGYNNNI